MSNSSKVPAISAIVFPDIADAPKGGRNGELSIRQIVLRGLAEGRSTASIAAVIKEHFPESMAAAKSSKHIAWYRGKVKKGEIKLPTIS